MPKFQFRAWKFLSGSDPSFSASIQQNIRGPSYSNQIRKRNKRYPNWKGKVKIVTIFGDMISYVENPNISTQTLLELKMNSAKKQDTRLKHINAFISLH